MPKLQVQCIPVGSFQSNCYLVENTENGQCLVVDPGAEEGRILAALEGRHPVAVLLTHGHCDHIGAVDAVCEKYGVPLYVHQADAHRLGDAQENLSIPFGFEVVVHTRPSVLLQGGENLELAGIPLQVLHTPGHSEGSVCYLLPEGQGILTGDTLFAHGYGRTDFPDGSFMKLKQSLRTLFHLHPQMTVYPGHDETGVVGTDVEAAQ